MKKQLRFSLIIITLISLGVVSCSESLENNFRINNLTEADVVFHFRAAEYEIPVGQEKVFNDVPGGLYEYETVFSSPAGVKKITIQGPTAGDINFVSGSKAALTLYSNFNRADSSYLAFGVLSLDQGATLEDPLTNP